MIPPVPANFQKLTIAQRYLMEVFTLNQGLVEAAATLSPSVNIQKTDYLKLIPLLSLAEKDAFLLKIVQGERRIEIELRKKLETLSGDKAIAFGQPIHWEALLEISNQKNKETEEAFAEEQKQLHIRKMKSLIFQKQKLWEEVEIFLLRSTSKSYDGATEILCQLKEVAEYEKKSPLFQQKINEWAKPYTRKGAFMRRLRENGLV